MSRYTDEFRANSVIMLKASGYPERTGALNETAKYLKVPHTTLRRWFQGESNPPPAEIVQIKKEEIIALLKGEIGAALKEMGQARADADYKELATSIGIMVDKMQLLDGEPTARTEVIHELSDDERAKRIDELLNRGRARRDGRPASDELIQ